MAKNATIRFALEGAIREFKGTLFQLRTQITAAEWEEVVRETVKYRTFISCLKNVGMPRLGEKWTKEEQADLRALDKTIASMRGMDPLLVASVDADGLYKRYSERMEKGAESINEMVQEVADGISTQVATAHENARHETRVSGL